ncbi:thioredoxin domain-containing protein [Chitinophaga sp. S165]|uniref:DsbA family protein n=1 Tax=Chitinophaga sp. S165 TaxID=2135462 RepID=UPI000D71590B|nr:thioredoxin domain-containing protein [Chitinophaga sp. S165]PWV54047.1 thioredoxin-like protein [Chitinophaga sp. S165]
MLHPIFNAVRDHYQGNQFAPVELLMYSDLQNAACAAIYPAIKHLMCTMGKDLKFVFRHYPAPDKHPLSLEAAIATEIAATQGKFWEMHDIIIENQSSLTRTIFPYLASAIGVEMPLYEEGRRRKQVFHKIINDYESGNKSCVDVAPTIFINGRKYNGHLHYATLYKTCKYAMTISQVHA